MNYLQRPRYNKAFLLVTLAASLLYDNTASAQDTYWALTGNRRLNTFTEKVISNRSGDAAFPLSPGDGIRGMFDSTGRCLFYINNGVIGFDGIIPNSDNGGGLRAFPITTNDKCKQYAVIDCYTTSGHPPVPHVDLQLVDASQLNGISNSGSLSCFYTGNPTPIPNFVGGSTSGSEVAMDVVPAPNGEHYLYIVENSVNSADASLQRWTIHADGSYDPTPLFAPTFIDELGDIAKIRVSPDNKSMIYCAQYTDPSTNLTSQYVDWVNITPYIMPGNNVAYGAIMARKILSDKAYGFEYAVVNGLPRWYFSTADYMGYMEDANPGSSPVYHGLFPTSGAKSDLAMGGNNKIYYAKGDPSQEEGTLYNFDPNAASPVETAVPGASKVVYSQDGYYQFGNMVEGENTSTARNYDEYDEYTVQAGNLNWTPTNNPATDYNGGGTYPVYHFKKDMIVPPSINLSVTGMTIEMAKDASIMVQKADKDKWAGRLLLDNATVTGYTECGGTQALWSGIQLWGDNTKTQAYIGSGTTNSYQGALRMQNEATLSYARLAVQMTQATDNTYTSGGGIIYASKSHFINNLKSVAFFPYPDPNSNIIGPYHSNFRDCEFRVDADQTGFIGFISGWSLHGLDIFDNNFTNLGANTVNNNYGVAGYDFGVNIGYAPNGPGNSFFNINHGVEINTVSGAWGSVSVRGATFYNNNIGVSTSAVQYPVILDSRFMIPSNKDYGLGINIYTGSGYVVSGNDFTGLKGNGGNTGVLISSTGMNNNLVNYNTYQSLTTGNLSNYQNRSLTNSDGLQFICNTHSHNITDEAILGDDPYTQGIAANQGNTATSAGNSFTNSGSSVAIDNKMLPINYYYFSDPSFPAQNPVTTIGAVTKIATSRQNACQYEGGHMLAMKPSGSNSENQENGQYGDVTMAANELRPNLNASNTPYSLLTKVDMMVETGHVSEASDLYNSISKNNALTGTEAEEFKTYGRQLLDIRIAQRMAGKNLKAIDATQVAILESVVKNGKMWAKVRAQNWLGLFDGRTFKQEILFPENTGGDLDAGQSNIISAKKTNIYPNPIHDLINISYCNSSNQGAIFVITDLTGKLLQQQELKGKTGIVTLDVHTLFPGMYLYKITEGKQVTLQGKVVKQ